MPPARRLRRLPAPDRRARPLGAIVLALLVASAVALPVAAVDPDPGPAAEASAAVSPTASASGSATASPSASSSASASAPASASPSASPSGSPSTSPSFTPSQSPSPTASPSPLPTPVPSPVPSPTWPAMGWPTSATTLGTSTTFYGRGWGHGVGLNQYGAKGRALAGQTAEQILAAYYRGAKPATVSPTRNVRVLVLAGYTAVKSAPLVIHGRKTEWKIDGIAKRFPANGVLKLYRSTSTVDGVATTTWRLRVYGADGTTLLHSAVVSGSVVVRPTSTSTRLQLDSRTSSYDTYRGLLKVKLAASSATVINHVELDLYIRGVVPVEMSPDWPTEALRAQTAAARSFAVRRLHPGEGSFDLYDDTRSQVYRGVEAERSTTSSIIRRYPGQVIAVNGTIVNAFFFATGGGSTENNEYVFVSSSGAVGSAVSYLRGIPDRRPDGKAWDAGAPRWSWATSSLTRAQLSAMFKGDSRTRVGDLTKLGLTRRGVSGRLYRVTLYGSAGSKTVSADVFRAVYNARRPAGTLPLQSNLFDTRPLAGS